MTLKINHPFHSTIPDDPVAIATGRVTPSEWNRDHTVTGTLNISNFNSGLNASSSTFWRGDGTWVQAPAAGSGSDPAFLTQGFSLSITNPVWSTNPTENYGAYYNFRYENVNAIDPTFSNAEGIHLSMQALHGDATYSPATQAKTTWAPLFADATFFAGAQRFLLNLGQHSYGMGDAGLLSMIHDFAGGPLPGDEGIGYTPVTRVGQAEYDRRCTISNVHRASGNTTITPAIVSNKNPQTVAVGSTVNINPGEWYVVEQQTDPESNTEAIQIVSVGVGTITAIFRNNHPAGVALTPALCMDQDSSFPGQLRVIVNLSGASYSAGTITGTFGAGAVTGNLTAWADNMVGGDVINVGALSMTKDELTTFPGDPLYPYRSWYEIKTVDSPTQLEIQSMSVANDQSYHSTRGTFPTNYIIRPAVRILRVLPGASLVCFSTSTVWNNGDTCEISVCPYPDVSGVSIQTKVYTPGATNRAVMSIANTGAVPFTSLLGLGGRYLNTQIGADKPYTAEIGLGIDLVKTGITINGVSKTLVPDGVGLEINNELPINWTATKIWGGLADPFFKVAQGSVGNVDLLPPSFEVNTDANLCEANFNKYWLNLKGILNVAKPYMVMDNSQFSSFSSALGPTKPIEVVVGAQGFIVDGNITDANARNSCIHQYGMGTAGALTTARLDVIAVNGVNNPFTILATSFIRITGPTLAFSIQGFDMGAWGPASHPGGDGIILRVFNATPQAMTIVNNAGFGGSDILTLTGADVVLAARTSFATFIYSGTDARWILTSTN